MRKPLALLALSGLLALPAAAATTVVSKPPDLGPTWFPLQNCCGGSYAYADSFLAPEGDRVPIRLGAWLLQFVVDAPPIRFEIWGDAGGAPDPGAVLATTGPVAPAVSGTLTYFEFPVTGAPAPLTPGTPYWFVATVVGEPGAGAYKAGGHTQNSVHADDGVFMASNDPAGEVFDIGPTIPEMAYQVELGPEILLFSVPCGSVEPQFETALDAMGLLPGTTVTADPAAFGAALTGGAPWDLVLVDAYDGGLAGPELAALIDYIADGGRVAASYWALWYAPDLVAALDAAGPGPTLTTPQSLHLWDAAHPLFLQPDPIAGPIAPLSDTCDEDGARYDPAPGGTAVGGYTASPTAGQAAIVIGNSGRSVLLGEVLNVFASVSPSVADGAASALPAEPGLSLASNTLHYLLDAYLFGNDFEVDRTCRWSNRAPTPVELCSDLDDDCDGLVDDGDPGGGDACDTGLFGICAAGLTLCDVGGVLVCDQQVEASAETCNDLDDNCDGATDEGNPGSGQACDTGIPGACAPGLTSCEPGGVLACLQQTFETPEQCNDLDDDCDGVVDNGNPGGDEACDTGIPGECAPGLTFCDTGGVLACLQQTFETAELCNDLDDDCDGVVDNGDPGGGESCDTGLPGACGSGLTSCAGGSIECQQIVFEEPEINDCEDGIDNDCDGAVDCSDSDCVNEPACCTFFVEGLGCLREAPPTTSF